MTTKTRCGLIGMIVGLGFVLFQSATPLTAQTPTPWDVTWLPNDQASRNRIAAEIDRIVVDPNAGSISGEKSGLKGKGATILRYATESIDSNPNGVNPAFALAMFRKEANFAALNTPANTQNNPGNIICTGFYGDTGCTGRFAVFPTMDDGIKAYYWLLTREYKPGSSFARKGGCKSIDCIIQIYCPPSDCDTNKYISQVSEWTNTYQSRLIKASRLDYDARAANSIVPQTLFPSQSAVVRLSFSNAGANEWSKNDVTLVNTNGQSLGSKPRIQLTNNVKPNETASFNISINAPSDHGAYLSEWQLERAGQRFGDKTVIALTVLPKEVEDKWKQFTEFLQSIPQRLLTWLGKTIQQTCAGTVITTALPSLILVYRKRRFR